MNGPIPSVAGAPPADVSEAGVHRAVILIEQLITALGSGRHTLTCAAAHPGGTLQAFLEIESDEDGLRSASGLLPMLIIALAHAVTSRNPAGVITRSHGHGGDQDVVRGWLIAGGRPAPLAAAQVKAAYSTDAQTGEPLSPDPDTVYQPGFPLPDLDDVSVQEVGDDGAVRPE